MGNLECYYINFDEHMKAISMNNILIHDLVHGLHTVAQN